MRPFGNLISTMFISVIIPVYNRSHLIGRALDSVLQQTRPADEIIIVDDGSTDDLQNLLGTRYPGVRLLQQAHAGVSKARNVGIRASRGDWIALLDSDDSWQPDKLQKQCDYIRQHPATVLLHTDETWIRNGVRVNAHDKHKKSGGHIFQRCLPLCCISPSSVLIKATLLDEAGLFDEQLPACEDYDLWLRICAHHRTDYIDEPLITKYGGHADQLSRQHWGMDRFRIQALIKIIEQGQLGEDDRIAVIQTLQEKLKIVMNGAKKHGNKDIEQQYAPVYADYVDEMQPAAVTSR